MYYRICVQTLFIYIDCGTLAVFCYFLHVWKRTREGERSRRDACLLHLVFLLCYLFPETAQEMKRGRSNDKDAESAQETMTKQQRRGETVACFVCNEKQTKKNMQRHWERNHLSSIVTVVSNVKNESSAGGDKKKCLQCPFTYCSETFAQTNVKACYEHVQHHYTTLNSGKGDKNDWLSCKECTEKGLRFSFRFPADLWRHNAEHHPQQQQQQQSSCTFEWTNEDGILVTAIQYLPQQRRRRSMWGRDEMHYVEPKERPFYIFTNGTVTTTTCVPDHHHHYFSSSLSAAVASRGEGEAEDDDDEDSSSPTFPSIPSCKSSFPCEEGVDGGGDDGIVI